MLGSNLYLGLWAYFSFWARLLLALFIHPGNTAHAKSDINGKGKFSGENYERGLRSRRSFIIYEIPEVGRENTTGVVYRLLSESGINESRNGMMTGEEVIIKDKILKT